MVPNPKLNRDLANAAAAFARRSVRLRQLHRLSQRAAAKKVGIGTSALGRIERGTSINAPLWIVIKLCTAYEISPDTLLGYDRIWPGPGQCQRCSCTVSGDPHALADCLVAMYDQGFSVSSISSRLNVPVKVLHYWLNEEIELARRKTRDAGGKAT